MVQDEIPLPQEAKAGELKVQGQPGQLNKTLSKNKQMNRKEKKIEKKKENEVRCSSE